MKYIFILILQLTTYLNTVYCDLSKDEAVAELYLRRLNKKAAKLFKLKAEAKWQFESNITHYNLENMIAVNAKVANETRQNRLEINKFNWRSFKNYELRRQFKKYASLGRDVLPPEKYKKFMTYVGDMVNIYASTKICDYKNKSRCDLQLEPDLRHIWYESRDPEELQHIWLQWRNATGSKIEEIFEEYVKLSNEAAQLDNFTDTAQAWLSDYESDDIREQFHNLWEQVKPLYMQLHAYVRYKLREKYGNRVSEKGPIPGHLLGNMWAQIWQNIFDYTLPYPNHFPTDITEEMIRQNYTPEKVFQTANNFFVSLNLTGMPKSFWKKSILKKPSDGRDLLCHPMSDDFYDGDVRIRMCTVITQNMLYIAHHEIGHAEYFLQYAEQPPPFRDAPNQGFHEAIGDAIGLSVSSPKYLHKIGLLNQSSLHEFETINRLYEMALYKISILPFAYIVDLWRWDVFSNKITKEDWNCKWWELKQKYAGVGPPVVRSADDFDPAAKYHIIADVTYIRYFVSIILQFQFYKALCLKTGEYEPNNPKKPLHDCDIYNQAEAGNLLKKMLKMGSSRPWPDVLKVLTGQKNMDASSLIEYFKPLQNWLEQENRRNGAYVGFDLQKDVCLEVRTRKGTKDK